MAHRSLSLIDVWSWGSELLYFILCIISVEIIDRSHDRDRDRELRITHIKYFPYYHRRGFPILGDRHPSCVLFTCRSIECHIVVYLYFGDNVTSTNLFIITISSIIIIIIIIHRLLYILIYHDVLLCYFHPLPYYRVPCFLTEVKVEGCLCWKWKYSMFSFIRIHHNHSGL